MVPEAPSITSHSVQPVSDSLVADHGPGEARSSSPIVPDETLKNAPQVQIDEETVGAELGGVDASTGEGVTVAEMEDEDFGQFVSISNISSDSRTEQPVSQDAAEQDTITEPDTSGSNLHTAQQQSASKRQWDSTDTNVTPYQVSSLSESAVMPADSFMHPDLRNNVAVDSPVLSSQSPLKGVREGGKAVNQSPEVDRLSLKKNAVKTTGSRTDKKQSKNQRNKLKTKKSRSKAEAMDNDDNQSEMSYQPDTDLSRSKAARKVNGKFHIH